MTKPLKYTVVSLSSGLLAILLVGTFLGRSEAAEDAYRHFAVYSEVLSRVKSDYVEEPDMKSVTLGAINGLLESVDPFASYLSADQFKQYLKSKENPRAGTGLVLSRRYGYVSIVGSIPGTPAHTLGLTTGEVIEAINGVATRDMPLAFAEVLLDGEQGSNVELSVLRLRRGSEAQKMGLTRTAVRMPAITANTPAEGVGYIQVPTLEAGKAARVAQQLAQFEKDGVQKLVLDLRYCAYGSPDEGVALANLFQSSGLITYSSGQKSPREDFNADPAKTVWKHPVVVLINRGTASGAEVAAAALGDSKRAQLVGERTYGEAARRKSITLDDGSAVILAVAKFYSPSGKSIPDNGVTPGVAVNEPEPASGADDEDNLPAPPQDEPAKPGRDAQLDKALEILTGVKPAAATPKAA
jgi:carboxyl-terminal processing protease